jgi:hypothetical protein
MPRPEHHAQQIARGAAAACWIYQGLVPKLLGPHADELAMVAALGVPAAQATTLSMAAGVAEIALGLAMLVRPRAAWPHRLALAGVAGLLGFVALRAPHFLAGAFNPVAMNLALGALSAVALALMREPAPGPR